MVEAAYSDLFNLHGKESWTLAPSKLISFFRGTDHTSAIVGQRQAGTFQTLVGLAGRAEVPTVKTSPGAKKGATKAALAAKTKTEENKPPLAAPQPPPQIPRTRDVGLTVRIEINLPAAADQETYDRIFKSIKENLLNG